ncbi:MAG TPA: hypothetical protein VNN77_04470 [candidate division Zixibacteria bacterium]|nr:hypothetical protein [candidate division Zixibacteria bacterium]
MANRYAEKIFALARAYRDAEAEVVSAFFSRRRSRREHLRWLKAQAYKEYSAIRPIFTAVASLYPEVGRGIDRGEFQELTEKLADETRHARLLMDLLDEIAGARTRLTDLLWLPEDQKLARIRGKYSRTSAALLHGGTLRHSEVCRTDEALERAAIALTEGGGGALYLVCSRLGRSGVSGKIARVFREILRDETAHKDAGARALRRLVNSRRSFQRAADIVRAISSQRLRMRNEQFGFPLSPRRIAELDRRARQACEL